MYGDKCGEFACGYWGFAWIMVRNRKVSFEIKWTKRSLELTEVIWSEAFPPPRIPSLWADVLRLPFVWKTRKFQDVLCQSEPFEIDSTESESKIRVDRQIWFEYATCGHDNFWIRKEKFANSKIVGYVWSGP